MDKNADLNLEVDRKIRLATQAIAARHEIMEELNSSKGKLQHAAYEQERLAIIVKKAVHEKEEYQKRHDEMFGSVSTLNQRIEELE